MTVSALPPFKAEVVGSLLRPAAIHEARSGRAQGRVSADELWAIETRAIEDALALQRDAGLKVCTDGELRRRHWFMDFIERIEGVGFEGSLPTRFHNEAGDIEFAPPRVVVKGKLTRTQPLAVHHFAALKPLADRAGLVAKQPIPSPTILHFRGGRAAIDKAAYPDIGRVLCRSRAESIARRSRRSIRPAAATCRSTKPTCRSCAIRKCGTAW